MDTQSNAKLLQDFACFIAEAKPVLQRQYQQHLAADLATQQWQGCFQRNLVAVLAAFYPQALQQLKSLPFDASQVGIENGMSELTGQVLTAFTGFSDELMLFAVDKHRTSCALSNFAEEHKPNRDYLNATRREIAGLWKTFALDLNRHFLEGRC